MPKKSEPTPSDAQGQASSQEAAQQIWLAGLGAMAQAQKQGGQVFKTLVQDGLAMQRKTQEAARQQMAQASEKLSSLAAGLGSSASPPWDRLEGIFEQRVGRALQRLDVASRKELEALQGRVQALEAQLRQLAQGSAPTKTRKPASDGHPRAKTAAKRPKRAD